MNTARYRAAALLALSLRAFPHSTNIGSGIDLIDDLEGLPVGAWRGRAP